MSKRPYETLLAWQQAHRLCLQIYHLTLSFPSEERFRLADQMVRAARSVGANIAEGNGRRGYGDKRKFFAIALASLDEVHNHCLLARDLLYMTEKKFDELDK